MIAQSELLLLLERNHLLNAVQLSNAKVQSKSAANAKALAKHLLDRGWLTAYQANQLMSGHGNDLSLGSYVLLNRLGEGGMGTVFKARNWKMERIVALKLIRKERLTNPDTVKRFRREIEAAAKLDHPNIVRVFDADEMDDKHFMVMEYVQGSDLSEYVKKHGPATVDKACDFIRQAAVGLQHAYDCGLVHRDMKPSNLFLSTAGVVKVLDMGLARLTHQDSEDPSGSLTAEGSIMGTPDFIAPEQAVDSKNADIRADIYSLGCTLYFLLTGRPPFPGSGLMEKLMQHQMDDPPPISQFRNDVPDLIVAIIARMMAKKPNDRFQTPQEVAEALVAPQQYQVSSPSSAFAEGFHEPNPVFAFDAPSSTSEIVHKPKTDKTAPPQFKRSFIAAVCAIAGVFIIVMVGVIFLLQSGGEAPHEPKTGARKKPPRRHKPIVQMEEYDTWLRRVIPMPAKEKAVAVTKRLQDENPIFEDTGKYKIENGKVSELTLRKVVSVRLGALCALTHLKKLVIYGENRAGLPIDLTPLTNLALESLELANCPVTNLVPLQKCKIKALRIHQCGVTNYRPICQSTISGLHIHGEDNLDLNQLKESKLTSLYIGHVPIDDLTPLEEVPLKHLTLHHTQIADLRPLAKLPLESLGINFSPVSDFAPLQKLKLKSLNLQFDYERDGAVVKSITTLTKINDQAPATFWQRDAAERKAFASWCDQVAAMPMADQKKTVEDELKKRNAGFARAILITAMEDNQITGIEIADPALHDLTPVRALRHLKSLRAGSPKFPTKIFNLWPIKDLPITELNVQNSPVADLRPLNDMPLAKLVVMRTKVSDLSPLKGRQLSFLDCRITKVADLTPLQDMPISVLHAATTEISDLTPLQNSTISELNVGKTKVTDLSPLSQTKLQKLTIDGTSVSDISPLRNLPVEHLKIARTKVTDLSPLRKLKLLLLSCEQCGVTDLAPLKGMPLQRIFLRGTFANDTSVLTKMPLIEYYGPVWPFATMQMLTQHASLEKINGLEKVQFNKNYEPWMKWIQMVHGLDVEKQSAAVAKKLQELNAGFDGKIEWEKNDDGIKAITIRSNAVNDFTPLFALPHLRDLRLDGAKTVNGKMKNLAMLPLLSLKSLSLENVAITDLAPLQYFRLASLTIAHCPATDLQPIRELKLKKIDLNATKIEDLSPLGNMPLEELECADTPVWDLTPVANASIHTLDISNCPMPSYQLVERMPLKHIALNFEYERDQKWLKAMPMLQTINGKKITEFWEAVEAKRTKFETWKKQVAAMAPEEKAKAVIAKLKEMNPDIKGKEPTYKTNKESVHEFDLAGTTISDLSPLAALTNLTYLRCGGSKVRSFWPLRHLRLKMVHCPNCPICDLRPLENMPIEYLYCPKTKVRNLHGLKNMTKAVLHFATTKVTDITPLKGLAIREINLDFDPKRHTQVLKSLPILEKINGLTKADFWKKYGSP